MKRAGRVAAALCLAGSAGVAWAMTPAEVYALVSPSVWRVVTYDVDGLRLPQGSAVVIGAETLATNRHVLAKAKRVVVRHVRRATTPGSSSGTRSATCAGCAPPG